MTKKRICLYMFIFLLIFFLFYPFQYIIRYDYCTKYWTVETAILKSGGIITDIDSHEVTLARLNVFNYFILRKHNEYDITLKMFNGDKMWHRTNAVLIVCPWEKNRVIS